MWCHAAVFFGLRFINKGLHVRAAMTLPLILMQLNLLTEYQTAAVIALLPSMIFDSFVIYSWVERLLFVIGQTFVWALMMRFQYFNPDQNGYECLLSFSYFRHFALYLFILAIDVSIFVVLEKMMKENWVIRDSTDKSFKQLLNMIDEHPSEIFVVDQNMKIKFFNDKFWQSAKLLQADKIPFNSKDLIHSDDREAYLSRVSRVIAKQRATTTTINFEKFDPEEDKDDLRSEQTLLFSDSKEEYHCSILPIHWKGAKAVMITLENIQEEKIKSKLLENQANEIESLFQDIIQNLEQDLSFYSPNSK